MSGMAVSKLLHSLSRLCCIPVHSLAAAAAAQWMYTGCSLLHRLMRSFASHPFPSHQPWLPGAAQGSTAALSSTNAGDHCWPMPPCIWPPCTHGMPLRSVVRVLTGLPEPEVAKSGVQEFHRMFRPPKPAPAVRERVSADNSAETPRALKLDCARIAKHSAGNQAMQSSA